MKRENEILSSLHIVARALWSASCVGVPIAMEQNKWMRNVTVGDIVIEITRPLSLADAEISLGKLIESDKENDKIVVTNLLSGKKTTWHNAEFVRILVTESGEFVDDWPR